jgi:hypothetical protein
LTLYKKLVQQGQIAVIRDDKGTVVAHAPLLPAKSRKETWRAALRRLTNNGADLHATLYNLSQGTPLTYTLPDGRTSEPIIPSPEVMRAAAVNLIEFLHGKAVAQSEVTKAEEDSVRLDQLSAYSDEELRKIVEGEFKVLEPGT